MMEIKSSGTKRSLPESSFHPQLYPQDTRHSENQLIPSNITLKTEPLSNYNILKGEQPSEKTKNRYNELMKLITKNSNQLYLNDLKPLIKEFNDIFHVEGDKMTVNNFYKQHLRIVDNTPTYIKNYRQAQVEKEEVEKQVQKLLKNNLIEPSMSNCNSPISF